MSNVDPQTLAKWVTLSTWSQANGKVTTSEIRAGFPIAMAQIDPNSSRAFETRLSLALSGTNDYYVVVPVKPDTVGNYVQPGDRVDIILNLGSADRKEALVLGVTQTLEFMDLAAGQSAVMTQTLPMPVSKLVMQNMTVLRVDRDRPRATTAANNNADQSQNQPPQDTSSTLGDIRRLYIKVDRDQLEIMSFVMNNSGTTIAVRAANGSQLVLPTGGVTWNDFVRWFYSQRGNEADGVQPFDAIGSQPVQQPAPGQ
jgi:Flp pilus assembly protein CpaB